MTTCKVAGTMMSGTDGKKGGNGNNNGKKTTFCSALHKLRSEGEYQTKKTNMGLEGNTEFSYILERERERGRGREECKGGH